MPLPTFRQTYESLISDWTILRFKLKDMPNAFDPKTGKLRMDIKEVEHTVNSIKCIEEALKGLRYG